MSMRYTRIIIQRRPDGRLLDADLITNDKRSIDTKTFQAKETLNCRGSLNKDRIQSRTGELI